MTKRWILALLLLVSGCNHKVQTQVQPAVPAGPPEYEVVYQDGLKAFREATPEGYRRAAELFRRAADLRPAACEYSLHLSESLFFVAQQQKLNWSEFQPAVLDANAIVLAKQDVPECITSEAYLDRLRALNLSFNGSRANTLTTINRAIELDPKDPMNWVVLSQLVNRPSVTDPVVPILHAVELAPDLALVQYELGNFYLGDQKTYSQAKEAFARAIELSPRHFQAVIGLAYVYWTEGDDAAADQVEPLLKKAVDLAPDYLKGRTLLGDYYAGLEETEKAIEQYEAATATNPKYYPAFLSMGSALLTAERNDDAEKPFNTVIQLDVKTPRPPQNASDWGADCQAHDYLGDIWMGRDNLTKAMAEYQAALQDIGNFTPAIYGMAMVYHRLGNDDDALKQLDRVILLDSRGFPNAYLARGGIKAERRQFPAALSDLTQAITIYQQQVVQLKAKVEADDAKGWKRRANGERRRQSLLESVLQRAIESKKAVEALAGG